MLSRVKKPVKNKQKPLVYKIEKNVYNRLLQLRLVVKSFQWVLPGKAARTMR